jgi:hypothetical protein
MDAEHVKEETPDIFSNVTGSGRLACRVMNVPYLAHLGFFQCVLALFRLQPRNYVPTATGNFVEVAFIGFAPALGGSFPRDADRPTQRAL